MSADEERYHAARAAVERAAKHADDVACREGWERRGGLWADEADDQLYDARAELGADTYALARELLAELARR